MKVDFISMKNVFFSSSKNGEEREGLLAENDENRPPSIRIINDSNREYDSSLIKGDTESVREGAERGQNLSEVELKTYKRRWAVLIVFFFLSVCNNFMEFAFSPISHFVTSYYGINELELNILALVYMITGCTTRFLAMWIIDTIGLGIGTYIATALHLVGSWLRFWPGYYQDQYVWLLVGQSVTALAQAFIDITGPKLAANWFPPNERTTATAAGGGSIFVAALLSYALVPRVVVNTWDMRGYLFIQAAVSTAACIGIALIFRGSPPVPPSYSAGQKKTSFWKALVFLITKKNFLILAFVFSITMSTGISILILLTQIMLEYNYTPDNSSTLATIWIASSVFGGILGGPIVDKTHAFKSVILTGLCLITSSLLAFTFALEFQHEMWILYIIVCVAGLGIVAMPAILEAAVEVIYPVPEATAMGILFFGLNVMSFFQSILIGLLKSDRFKYRIPLLSSVGICALTCIMVFFFKPKYERREFEKVEKRKTTIQRTEGNRTKTITIEEEYIEKVTVSNLRSSGE
eukprot:TRINITY_DN5327_c0_g1_i2.p1 TRINITY_DN5327_c0_g1~~TRINITY_DN5327_c0_g1_i2.p1  ORF type:complete len:522 (-),score=94.68 TRINITY_DN5327_c0_g1_i2:70-1635(-)